MKIFQFLFVIFMLSCSPANALQRELYIEKFHGWESSIIVSDSGGDTLYMTKYSKKEPPELFSLDIFTTISLNKFNRTNIIITLFGTKIINFSMKNLTGEIIIDGFSVAVEYDVSSDGHGIYFFRIQKAQNGSNIVNMMLHGKRMMLALPYMVFTRNIDLTGFSRAFARSSMLCAKGITR